MLLFGSSARSIFGRDMTSAVLHGYSHGYRLSNCQLQQKYVLAVTSSGDEDGGVVAALKLPSAGHSPSEGSA